LRNDEGAHGSGREPFITPSARQAQKTFTGAHRFACVFYFSAETGGVSALGDIADKGRVRECPAAL